MNPTVPSTAPSLQSSDPNDSRTGSQNKSKTPPKNNTAPKKTKQAAAREARLARKLERAMDLDHIVLWLRTTDAQIFRTMLYPLDRGCAKIRSVIASMEISLEQGQEILESVQKYIAQIKAVASSSPQTDLSIYGSFTPHAQTVPLTIQEKHMIRSYRKAIASQPGVDFYLPHSVEGKRFLEAIIALDSHLVRARASESLDYGTSESLDYGADLFKNIGSLIRRGHEIVLDLAAITKVQYEQHPFVKRMLKLDQQQSVVLK